MKNLDAIKEQLRGMHAAGLTLDQASELCRSKKILTTEEELGWLRNQYIAIQAESGSQQVVKDFTQQIANDATFALMQNEVKNRKISEQWERYEEADSKAEKLKSMDFLKTDATEIERLKKANLDALQACRDAKSFIGPMFNGIVPFAAKELILILGLTGGAKTTSMANIAWQTVKQRNPVTGKQGKVLIISNEEPATDILNRISCLAKLETPGNDNESWYYVDRAKFSDAQIES